MQKAIQDRLQETLKSANGTGLRMADLIERVMDQVSANEKVREVDVRAALLPMIRANIVEFKHNRTLVFKNGPSL